MISKISCFGIIIFSLVLLSCAVNPVTGRLEFMLISEEQENAIGKEVAPQVERKLGGVYHNRELARYVQEVGHKLARISHRPHINYRFKIVNSPVPNAISIPGGYIYITRGLLFRLKNEAQLAGVLGHEIAHITARHVARRLSQAMGFGVLIDIASKLAARGSKYAKERAQVVEILASIAATLILLKYSREDEYQADELGGLYAYKAGYDPGGMVEVLLILKQIEGRHKGAEVPEYFSTHPRTKKRIRQMQKEIERKYPRREGLIVGEKSFRSHMQKLWALRKSIQAYDLAHKKRKSNDLDTALKLINAAIKDDPLQPAYYIERANIFLKKGWYPRARKDFKTARDLDPGNFDALCGYGIELFRARQYKTAEGELLKAVSLIPSEPIAWYFLAEVRLALGKTEKAKKGFKRVLELTKEKPLEPYTSRSRKRLRQLSR